MPKHPDFQEIYNRFISLYGKDTGERIYYAYLHNEGLDDTKSLNSQKKNKDSIMSYLKSRDAIPGNSAEVQKVLNDFFLSEHEKYRLIIEKYIEDFYNQGISQSALELSMQPAEFGDLRGRQEQLKILKNNSTQLAFNLLDDINKEISLKITDISLNNIPISNSDLKKDIQNIFKAKQGRLDSQVVSESNRAFNTALEFGYKKSGVITHKQWVAILDTKTSSVCRQLNGEIVEIGKVFSLGFYTPPAHPNCRSRVVGITISEADMLINNDSINSVFDLPRFRDLIKKGINPFMIPTVSI